MRPLRARLTYANVAASLALFLALTGGSAVALSGTDRVDSGDIIDGEVRTLDLAGPEPWHLIGARGEPQLRNSGDCKWSRLGGDDPGLYNPASFYRDPFGIVHLAGALLVQDGPDGDGECGPDDREIFVLPPGYRPDNAEGHVVVGGPLDSVDGESAIVIGADSDVDLGGQTIPAGSVHTGNDPTVGVPGTGTGRYVLDGISFRAAGSGE